MNKMSLIKGYVEERVQEINYAKVPKPVKFSISIENETNFRLQYIAKLLETNRSNLAADFIQLAICEAEKSLGLNPFNFESDYGKAYIEKCGGAFHQDNSGYYRIGANGEKIKLIDPDDTEEIDYASQPNE